MASATAREAMFTRKMRTIIKLRSLANVNRAAKEAQSRVDAEWLREQLETSPVYELRKRRKLRAIVRKTGKKQTAVFMQMASGHAPDRYLSKKDRKKGYRRMLVLQ